MRPWSDRQMERLVGAVLRAGVLLATALVLAGAAIHLARHGGERADFRAFRAEPWAAGGLAEVARGVLEHSGAGLVRLGLLALIATPIARVACSLASFLAQRDGTYVAITLAVLAVLGLSLLGALP